MPLDTPTLIDTMNTIDRTAAGVDSLDEPARSETIARIEAKNNDLGAALDAWVKSGDVSVTVAAGISVQLVPPLETLETGSGEGGIT